MSNSLDIAATGRNGHEKETFQTFISARFETPKGGLGILQPVAERTARISPAEV